MEGEKTEDSDPTYGKTRYRGYNRYSIVSRTFVRYVNRYERNCTYKTFISGIKRTVIT